MWEVDYEVLIGRYLILLYTLQSCMQWEDVTVWTRLQTQIDSAARLMKGTLQRACREAVQYIGMCHNAQKQQQSLQPCSLTLSLSRSVILFCLHLSFCLSNSGSFFLSGLVSIFPLRAFSYSHSILSSSGTYIYIYTRSYKQ